MCKFAKKTSGKVRQQYRDGVLLFSDTSDAVALTWSDIPSSRRYSAIRQICSEGASIISSVYLNTKANKIAAVKSASQSVSQAGRQVVSESVNESASTISHVEARTAAGVGVLLPRRNIIS